MNVVELVVRLQNKEGNKISERCSFLPVEAKYNVIEHGQSSKMKNKIGKGINLVLRRNVFPRRYSMEMLQL